MSRQSDVSTCVRHLHDADLSPLIKMYIEDMDAILAEAYRRKMVVAVEAGSRIAPEHFQNRFDMSHFFYKLIEVSSPSQS